MLVAISQAAIEIIAVLYRKELAGGATSKSVWIAVAVALSITMLGLEINDPRTWQQSLLFIFSSI